LSLELRAFSSRPDSDHDSSLSFSLWNPIQQDLPLHPRPFQCCSLAGSGTPYYTKQEQYRCRRSASPERTGWRETTSGWGSSRCQEREGKVMGGRTKEG